jgi:hypothetical protein
MRGVRFGWGCGVGGYNCLRGISLGGVLVVGFKLVLVLLVRKLL